MHAVISGGGKREKIGKRKGRKEELRRKKRGQERGEIGGAIGKTEKLKN